MLEMDTRVCAQTVNHARVRLKSRVIARARYRPGNVRLPLPLIEKKQNPPGFDSCAM